MVIVSFWEKKHKVNPWSNSWNLDSISDPATDCETIVVFRASLVPAGAPRRWLVQRPGLFGREIRLRRGIAAEGEERQLGWHPTMVVLRCLGRTMLGKWWTVVFFYVGFTGEKWIYSLVNWDTYGKSPVSESVNEPWLTVELPKC